MALRATTRALHALLRSAWLRRLHTVANTSASANKKACYAAPQRHI